MLHCLFTHRKKYFPNYLGKFHSLFCILECDIIAYQKRQRQNIEAMAQTQTQTQSKTHPSIRSLSLAFEAAQTITRQFNQHMVKLKREGKDGGYFRLTFGSPQSEGKVFTAHSGKEFSLRTRVGDQTWGRQMPQIWFAGARFEEDGSIFYAQPCSPQQLEDGEDGKVGIPWRRLLRKTFHGRDDVPVEGLQLDCSALDLVQKVIATSPLRTSPHEMESARVFTTKTSDGLIVLHIIWGSAVHKPKTKNKTRALPKAQAWDEPADEALDELVEDGEVKEEDFDW